MAVFRLSFISFLVVCAVKASQVPEAARDQYKANKDVDHPLHLPSEATDKIVDDHDFLSNVKLESPLLEDSEKEFPLKKLFETRRHSRSVNKRKIEDLYNPWNPTHVSPSREIPPLQSFSAWQPQTYQIRRPYFIPVFGSASKLIYFAPQPLYLNPGYPIDNRPNKGYLPPDPNQNASGNSTVSTINKFGDDDDDSPIWGMVPANPTPASVKPTRRTRPPGRAPSTYPPLVHSDDANYDRPVGNQLSVATTTQRTVRPQKMRPKESTTSDKQPTRCVWAIISCCSAASHDISYDCFEQLGCFGAFWGNSPCESEFARAAIDNVMNYYNANV